MWASSDVYHDVNTGARSSSVLATGSAGGAEDASSS